MQWADRVKQWHIRRLYKLAQLGIYDDDLLLEVGWGLYVRSEDVLTVVRAMGGEVPCPHCGHIVHRSKYYRSLKIRERTALPSEFSCPNCNQRLTWWDCREALRNQPKCFECQARLDWNYTENILSCSHCRKEWSWQQYRESIKYRTWLPCPHCGKVISRPKQKQIYQSHQPNDGGDMSSPWGELKCPSCGRSGVHSGGRFRCLQCGYEKEWRKYVERFKRRVEHLQCGGCGHTFSWNSWRHQYLSQGSPMATGNPAPVKEFLSRWPKCKTPQEQIIQIDNLIHALHGRGALAPLFIEGSSAKVMAFLDELAMT